MNARDFERVEDLYHAALARPAGERESFLREACAGDADLHREVTSLLSNESEARRLLEEGAIAAVTQRVAVDRGTRLGPYEILEPLGEGGMGEVYRARDTRLNRTVALKVLRSEHAADPELKARLVREARAISALSHPNICTLYDVGEDGGRTFLVMEHLVGQTLAQRLEKGPLPLNEALDVATQIAEALSAAHKKGVVHRDLKPGNVILTKKGARLLDFGLARLVARRGQPALQGFTSAPTEKPLTGAGTVMGTLPYMSPEQVEGRPADARADIWALGTILYEMMAGTRAFDGSSSPSLMAAILEREPVSLAERQPLTSSSVDRLVRRCLAKDPDDRWESAHDVAVRMRELVEEAEGAEQLGAPRTMPPIPLLVAVAMVSLLLGALGYRQWRVEPDRPVVRSEIDLTAEAALRTRRRGMPWGTDLALSPDGERVAWSGRPSNAEPSALFLRHLATGEVRRLDGTDGASDPAFSPDGGWIAYCANGWLRKISVDGTRGVDLAQASFVRGLSWTPDGGFILLGSRTQGIRRVPAEGGVTEALTKVDPRRPHHYHPFMLPGHEILLVTTLADFPGLDGFRVEAFELADGTRKVVVENAADAKYLSSGHLVFVRQGVLMASPFDLERLELTTPPVPVVDGVSQSLNRLADVPWGAGQFAVSSTGLLLYVPGGLFEDIPNEFFLVDQAGRLEPLTGFQRPPAAPYLRFSPGGRRLASADRAGSGLLWFFDVERHAFTFLTHDGIATSPDWSPDGSRLAASWSDGGPFELWVFSVEDPEERERLTEGGGWDWAPSWRPDARFLAFVRGPIPHSDIYTYSFEDRRAVPFVATEAHETHPDFSADGRWLAYGSNRTGRREVYITSFPDRGRTLTVSTGGGRAPAWSRDGRRIYYLGPGSAGGASMMVVDVNGDAGGPLLGSPRRLFDLPDGFPLGLDPMRPFDLHPDGRRFLFGRAAEHDPPPPITRLNLVHNWFTELERLSPTQ